MKASRLLYLFECHISGKRLKPFDRIPVCYKVEKMIETKDFIDFISYFYDVLSDLCNDLKVYLLPTSPQFDSIYKTALYYSKVGGSLPDDYIYNLPGAFLIDHESVLCSSTTAHPEPTPEEKESIKKLLDEFEENETPE